MGRAVRSREFWLIVLLTAIGIFLRFWRLSEPKEIVFDETYYAKWGNDYLQGTDFFDVHPPLGKLLVGVGIVLFGYNSFGWRVAVAFFGSFMVPLTYFIAKRLFGPRIKDHLPVRQAGESRIMGNRIALLAALFVLIDGLLLVQSRMALLDSFLVAFTLAAYACFLAFRDAHQRAAPWWLLATGLFVGLTISVKWTGAAAVGVVLLFAFLWRKNLPKVHPVIWLISLIILPAALYIASFLFNQRTTDFWPYLLDWHKQTWNFHHTLTASHPYASRWWSWLYLARPVWYLFKEENGIVRGILALGNPLLWWASIPAILASLWLVVRKKEPQLLFPLIAFLAAYLPWALISRTQFQYYVIGGVPFMLILLAYWTDKGLKNPTTKPATGILIATAVLIFLFFLPLLIGYPISSAYYRYHIWFPTWI